MKPFPRTPIERRGELTGSVLHEHCQWAGLSIAVLIPCHNEAIAIAGVVDDFQKALPGSSIYVYDNNSEDGTADHARAAGAIVRTEPRQGKGNVVRRMFSDVDADIYVLVDGDGTYDAIAAPILITKMVNEQLDLVNGARSSMEATAFRSGHRFGNWMLSTIVQTIFGRQFVDMLSGYKVLSRRFVKSFPAMSQGFETETELAVHALELRMPCAELPTRYKARLEGSSSKLRTFRDGARILKLIAHLVKDERPMHFFGGLGLLLIIIATALAIPLGMVYLQTGLVPKVPTALLSVGLVIVGVFSILSALIMALITRTRQELKRLLYLSVPQFKRSD
jgi:hypothetical protein